MIAYIFGASEISDYEYYRNIIKKDSFIICADDGVKHAKALGLTPDVVIGDFDSLKIKEEYKEKIIYPVEKDDTDLALCINYAAEKEISECIAIGCLGGRLDHTIANIHLLKYAYDKKVVLEIIDNNTKVLLITGEKEIKNDNYKYISVFPLGDKAEGVSYKGLKYPLENAALYSGIPLGVSNQFEEESAKISCESGALVVMLVK